MIQQLVSQRSSDQDSHHQVSRHPRLNLGHMIPIAVLLHSALLLFPLQVGSKSVEKPQVEPKAVKVATLPSPSPTPNPAIKPATPKPSPLLQPSLKPIVQPNLQPDLQPVVQPQRTIVLPQTPPAPFQPVIPPSPAPVAQPSPSSSPVTQPSPQPSPSPKELNTTSDLLGELGGQTCGIGCFQIADVPLLDVLGKMTQQFKSQTEEIRDNNTDELLGYIVTNAKGEKEYLYYSAVKNDQKQSGEGSLIYQFRKLPNYITDRQQLAALGIM